MKKFIVKTDFKNMFDVSIELYVCPNCGQTLTAIGEDKWFTEHFQRHTCLNCNTHIFIVDKQCNIEKLKQEE